MTRPLHPLRRRILADRLVRRRAPDEAQRYAAAQRRGRIDPNPHQIDAVIFALQRIPEGGCVLADEVGLGKTIEAGLVIAQVLAEGAQRVLIIVPKPLLGQWRDELWRLFAIEVREVLNDPQSLLGDGVFIVGREWAGGENGSGLLGVAEPFDLAIIDEAHEIFAGIHRRYDKDGFYLEHANQAVMAHRVREALGPTPKLLLTATPIQNSLLELWGLVRYVDPTGTLLGDKPTFESLFCQDQGRSVVPQHAHELKQRVDAVVQRTLRRQAQPFLDVPFVARRTRLVEYAMSDEERQLYDDVTDYLMDPMSLGFDSANRTLLVIGFHRRMASSSRALAASLDTVHDRLRALLDDESLEADGADQRWLRNLVGDLDDDVADELTEETGEDPGTATPAPNRSPKAIEAEAAHVAALAERARSLPADAKAEALLEVVQLVRERGRAGTGQGKVVIFTESLVTQSWLRTFLVERGVVSDGEVTLFRGDNRSPRAREALERWRQEVADTGADDLSTTVATRLALVHEFRTRSALFIATEAGAKGLNLQFCDTLVNYDLPWNPQRIEQRIGRCHRYGQTRDVTVVNFLAADNEAQRLTFDLLSKKLELFGEVLDASDQVLHSPDADHIHSASLASSVGSALAGELRQIYARARSRAEIEAELKLLRERFEERRTDFEDTVARTRDLIESRLDASVHRVFQQLQTEVPEALRALDAQVEQVVCGYLDALGVSWSMTRPHDTCSILRIDDASALPDDAVDRLADGSAAPVIVGDVRHAGLDAADEEVIELLHLGHPLARAAVAHARGQEASAASPGASPGASSGASLGASPDALETPEAVTAVVSAQALRTAGLDAATLGALDGALGRVAWVRVAFDGLYPVERLALLTAVEGADGPRYLPLHCADALEAARFDVTAETDPETAGVGEPLDDATRAALDAALEDALAELEFDLTAALAPRVRARFERLVTQIERYVDDRMWVLRRRRRDLETKLAEAEQRLQSAPGPHARSKATAAATTARKRLEATDEALERLAAREDPTYLRWRTQARTRRSTPPRAEILVRADVRWQIVHADDSDESDAAQRDASAPGVTG